MPNKEQLDAELAAFLGREREAEDRGFTKGAILSAMKAFDARFIDHERKDEDRYAEIMRAISEQNQMLLTSQGKVFLHDDAIARIRSDIRELRAATSRAESKADDTGRHVLESVTDRLEREATEAKAEATDAKAQSAIIVERLWKVVLTVIGGILLMLAGAALARLGVHGRELP